MERFSLPTRTWFESAFPAPTRVQSAGWPVLTAGQHALLVAPTGSGKTLAAFLWAIDRCCQLEPDAPEGVRVLYVSPLKALVYDIERNLRAPLVGIQRAAERLGPASAGQSLRAPRIDVRTGDTPARERRQQLRHPGDLLVTTPESLFLILGSQAAATLTTVHTVIVDEIHVFAPSKRGAHLALSLERLCELTESEPQRVGLSATVRPADEVARFLAGRRPVEVVDASEGAHVDLEVVVPVPDMDDPPPSKPASDRQLANGGPILSDPELLPPEGRKQRSEGWRGSEAGGVWPSIYPELLERILAHRSTIVFVNSRGLCERLSQRLNDLAAERLEGEVSIEPPTADRDGEGELIRAHHGSLSHERRAQIEEALKAGRLKAIVATSSLELGIDMGAVDQVILVESPGSVARGLQRVGRAGHGVGERSTGVIFPKFKGDLLECAVVAERMRQGELEPVQVPMSPLDVLAQQIVAYCCSGSKSVDQIESLARRAHPFRDLSGEVLSAVLDMLSGRYPSDEFADLRPRLSWDRGRDLLSARRGAKHVMLLNAGTIPDRGLYGVFLAAGGPRVGELDEEMVYETRAGDTIILGASTWRVVEITRDRVEVVPAPGEPGRMPFWRGDGPGRPIELGRAMGAFLRALDSMPRSEAEQLLREDHALDPLATENLLGYIGEQREHTGCLPTDRAITVERFRDELGDWRVCVLTPFGSRVHAPWALALERTLGERAGFAVETMYTDDGIVLRFADSEELPPAEDLFLDPDEVEDLIVDQVGSSALFASHFRENAARALLLPRRRAPQRTPLWQQRLRAKSLLASVQRFSDFPVMLETYRECLRDVFDLPALQEVLGAVRRREIRVDDVETSSASPFARSLVFAYVANYLYDQDAPLAERKAQALTLDRNLLRELLGQAELRELIDAEALAEVEAELQGLAEDWQARDCDELHDLLRRIGDLDDGEVAARCAGPSEAWLRSLEEQRRACRVRLAGEPRWIASEDAARYRDALGVQPPSGLPDSLLAPEERPLQQLVARYARSHGPFRASDVAERFALLESQVEEVLKPLGDEGRLVRGEIRPGGRDLEWCEQGVLRRIKRRTLAKLRNEVAPVDSAVLARFLPRWHRLDATEKGAPSPRSGARRRGRRLEDAIAQLEGLPVAWSTLSEQLLPSRVDGFDLDQLDGMAASGELVWVGCGASGPRDGRVALYRRDRAGVLLRPPAESYEPPSPLHAEVLEYLERRGASFTLELERLPGLVAGERRRDELEACLWDLVWEGLITNDTFLPLRLLRSRKPRRAASSERGRFARRRSASLRLASPQPGRGRGGALAGGRWSLVEEILDPLVGDTEWAHAVASLLLERYGVVSRETVLAEAIAGGFAALLPVLRAMEESGRVRRGYFVEGLAGRQFALPAAVEQLRSERESEGQLQALPAVDPCNPYGAMLPWPPRRRGEGPQARRVPGAWLVLRGGVPLLFLEAGGRAAVTFAALDQEPDPAAAFAVLYDIARIKRRRTVRLQRIDGEPAAESPFAPALREQGFESDYRGLILAR